VLALHVLQVAQPVLGQAAGRAPQRHAHAAAAVMADDDHVPDVQQVDREVDHRQAVQVRVHDQVATLRWTNTSPGASR